MLKYLVNKLLIALILLCMSGLSQAQDLRWYDVEVVAFAHARGEYLNTETWPETWPQPETGAAINFDTRKHSLFAKKRPQGALSGVAKRIDKSSRYRMLTYQAWRQAGLPEHKAKAVHIQSDDSVKSLVPQGADEYGNAISELIQVPQLEGSITISLGRFLHIHTDLLYTAALEDIQILPELAPEKKQSLEESPAAIQEHVVIETSQRLAPMDSEQNRLQGFYLKTQRKTRSKETQFIDHPMFGLIVRITPVKTS
jgi:hypothetical protein